MKHSKQAEKNFGIPKVGYTPMDTVQMEGAMFRGMGNNKTKRPLIVRIGIIFLALMIFITPSLIIIYSLIYNSTVNLAALITFLLFSILFLTIGIKLIYSNIKK